jgi:hypothetical protein
MTRKPCKHPHAIRITSCHGVTPLGASQAPILHLPKRERPVTSWCSDCGALYVGAFWIVPGHETLRKET